MFVSHFGTLMDRPRCSLKQAIFLAVIFEFTGALVLGRVSAETIAGDEVRFLSHYYSVPSLTL